MEKKLLAIVETLKEYCSMLLGADITVYTNHKNLTYKNLNTQRVMQWRCYIEEFLPKIKYLEVELNVLANTFSHMPRTESTPVTDPGVSKNKNRTVLADFLAYLPCDNSENAPCGRSPSYPVQSFSFHWILCYHLA